MLTVINCPAILYPVAHIGGTGLASRIVAAQTAIKRFFCAQNSVLHYVGLSGTIERLTGATPVRQFHSVRLQMIGVIWCRVYNLIRVAIMKNQSTRAKSARNPTFNVYSFRKLILIGISSSLAWRLKRKNPTLIVKFVGFEGGVI